METERFQMVEYDEAPKAVQEIYDGTLKTKGNLIVLNWDYFVNLFV